jgi:hypothetical protein
MTYQNSMNLVTRPGPGSTPEAEGNGAENENNKSILPMHYTISRDETASGNCAKDKLRALRAPRLGGEADGEKPEVSLQQKDPMYVAGFSRVVDDVLEANNPPNPQQGQQMPLANNINPTTSSTSQLQSFMNQPPDIQTKTIADYAQRVPTVSQGTGGPELNAYYNDFEMGGPNPMNIGPSDAASGGSNHALQDYQIQLMLLEQQNKKRLMKARLEQDNMARVAPASPGGMRATTVLHNTPRSPFGVGAAPRAQIAQQFQERTVRGGRTTESTAIGNGKTSSPRGYGWYES